MVRIPVYLLMVALIYSLDQSSADPQALAHQSLLMLHLKQHLILQSPFSTETDDSIRKCSFLKSYGDEQESVWSYIHVHVYISPSPYPRIKYHRVWFSFIANEYDTLCSQLHDHAMLT